MNTRTVTGWVSRTLVVSMIALLATAGSASAVIASVTVTNPVGSEIWNGVHAITWSTAPAFDPGTVNIYLVNDLDSSTTLIASNEPNDGTYNWDTTLTQAGATVAGTQYRIRIASSADLLILDDSDTTFEIDNIAPVLNPITSVVSDAAPFGVLQIGDSITFTVSATTTEPGATVTGSYNGIPLTWSTSNGGVSYTATYTVASGHTDQSSALQISGVTMKDHASLGNTSTAVGGSDVAVTIDATRPTLSSVAIASDHTNTSYARTGSTVTVSFTSSESIATPTVTIAGNATVVSGGPTSWTAAYTFVGTEAEGNVPFSITFADLAGNAAAAPATATTNASSVTYDKTLPTATSITTKDADANGSVDRATIVFSEPVDDASFSAGAFTIGGNVGTSIVTGTANDNAFDVLLTTQVAGTDVKDVVYTAGTGADMAGNLLASIGSGGIVELDGAGPIMISALTTSTTSIAVTFSEDLNGTTDAASDFTIAGGTVSATSELTGVITLTTSAFGTGATPLVSLVGNGVEDLAGVTSPVGQTITPTDGVAPTIVSITSTTANGSYNEADPAVNITITFSEAITSAGGVTVNLDTTGSCTTGALLNQTTATCSYAIVDGHNSADLNDTSVTGTIADQATNALTNFVPATSLATGHAIVVDTTEPVITALTLTAGGACTGSLCGVGDTITVGITADAAGYTIGTITVNGVAVTGFTDNTGGSYSATYTIVEGNTDRPAGTVPVSATVVDLAGNVTSPAFTTVTVNTVAVDANTPAAPTGITLTDPINLANATSVTVSGSGEANATANWSIDDSVLGSPVTGTTPIDGLGAFSNGGINVSGLLDGPVTATVTVTDAAGNTSTSATDVVVKDVVVPTIAATGIVGATVQAAGDTITINFSEAVSPVDLTWSDNEFSSIQSPDGTAVNQTGAVFTPSTGSTTTLTITLAESVLDTTTYLRNGNIVAVTPGSGTIRDAALNPMANTEVVGTPVITGDVAAPTVALTYSPDRKVGDADTVTITATFNELIHQVVTPTIAISTPGNGSVSAVAMTASVSNTIWTYNWNVPAGYDDDGTATVTIVAQDLAGNANATATNNTRIIDNTQPQALTASPIGSSVAIANATATITMSEPVWLVDSSRIMLVNDATNASHAGVITSAGTNAVTVAYSGLVNGTTYRINMIPGAVRDEALNLSGVVGPLYFTTVIDLIAPVVNSLSAGTITPTGAVLSLTTDENASCRYATIDSAFGSMTAFTTTGGTSHSVSLAGLTPSTAYSYYVRCQDASAQLNTMTASAHVAFTTATPDTTGPIVSSVQATSITASGATITWATNELATSRIEYGTTSAYGSFTTADGVADLTSHSVALSGLTSGTEYHYRILSSDALGNATVSGDNTFTTLVVADTTAPAVPAITTGVATIDADQYMIAGTVADDGGTRTVLLYNGATLVGSVVVPAGQTSWSILTALNQVASNVFTATATDVAGNVSAASSSVTITEATTVGDTTAPAVPVITTGVATADADQYTLTGTAGADLPTDGTRVITITRSGTVVGSLSLPAGETDWSFTSPLLQGTTNMFSATSTDVAGNVSAVSSSVTITEADTTAPVISSIQPTSIAQTTATIQWTTNESSTTTVEYGLTGSYGSTATTGGSMTSHTQGLTGLTAGTEYHYRVRSTDGAGNESISDDATFTTSASTLDVSAPIVSNIQAGSITTSGATITWATDELATSRIEYGTTSAYGSFTAVDGVADLTSHSVALSGLTAGTDYHYRVISSDAVGNTTTSSDQTFTTSAAAADTTAPVAPVITTSSTTVDASTYAVSGTVTAESAPQTVTVYNGSTAVATVVVPATQTTWSVTVSLTQNSANAFTAKSTDDAGNVSGVSNTATVTEAEGAVSLAVTSIGATKTLATADDSYANGWEWEFLVTVPTAEASLSMKFDNFVSGTNTLQAAGNMRFYSAQSSNASTSGSAISIAGALTYAGPLVLTGDLDSVTAGRQIKIVVQTKVPVGTVSGSYSTSYGIKSN